MSVLGNGKSYTGQDRVSVECSSAGNFFYLKTGGSNYFMHRQEERNKCE
jgi:hypothetical protein